MQETAEYLYSGRHMQKFVRVQCERARGSVRDCIANLPKGSKECNVSERAKACEIAVRICQYTTKEDKRNAQVLFFVL